MFVLIILEKIKKKFLHFLFKTNIKIFRLVELENEERCNNDAITMSVCSKLGWNSVVRVPANQRSEEIADPPIQGNCFRRTRAVFPNVLQSNFSNPKIIQNLN